MKRVFAAIDISDKARDRISHYMRSLRNAYSSDSIKWEREGRLHLTVKFLGDADSDMLAQVDEVLSKAAASTKQFEITITGTGQFPPAGPPRVLWLGVFAPAELQRLHRNIEDQLEPLGFRSEQRTFRPHLTIGRVRRPSVTVEVAEHHLSSGFQPVRVVVNELILYESTLTAGGSVYKRLENYPLNTIT